jgi:mannobiose 2-epimerase
MVGLVYGYRMSDEERYLEMALKIWTFIKEFIIDHRQGEWFWKVDRYGNSDPTDEKAGFWKCPYHNSRACMEIERVLR